MVDYGENPWPGDYIADQAAAGVISRSMVLGGQAMHWGGVTNRFSEEDTRLKSMFGLAVDWPIGWSELERYYCEAERRLGVSGDPSPLPEDARSEPYPMTGMPLSWNLTQLKTWGEKSGIPFWGTPQAKNTRPYDGRGECKRCNTCSVCPTQARYAPDFTFKQLLESQGDHAARPHAGAKARCSPTAAAARRASRRPPDCTAIARTTSSRIAPRRSWSPPATAGARTCCCSRPRAGSRTASANSSGLVGKYMAGHGFIQSHIELDAEIYPGMNEQHSLISRQFFRAPESGPFVRHDLRLWESAVNRDARLRDDAGTVLLGDAVMADWKARTKRATARVRAYYDVHPDRSSELTLDPATKNMYGDPLPKIVHQADAASLARSASTLAHVRGVFERLAKADNGRLHPLDIGTYWDHPAGGCRMGTDPASSVTDSYGRTHDHENLFVVGAPTLPTAGCTNGTLTFAAVTLRSADHIATTLGGARTEARR